jgi:hypothetical protein
MEDGSGPCVHSPPCTGAISGISSGRFADPLEQLGVGLCIDSGRRCPNWDLDMGTLWWVLGLTCSGLVLAAIATVAYLWVLESRRRKRVLAEGQPTFGWLVQANQKLFEPGVIDLPALVLISPDERTLRDETFLNELAERIFDLKGTPPDECASKDEAFVAELMMDETYVEGKRDKLPKSFTQGRPVYLAHIFVYRDDLPGKRIGRRRIACSVIWDDDKSMICTRPVSREELVDEDE